MKRANDTLIESSPKRYCTQKQLRTSRNSHQLMDSSSSDHSSGHMSETSIDVDITEDKLLLFSPKHFKSPSYPSSYPPTRNHTFIHKSPPMSIPTQACPVLVRPTASYNNQTKQLQLIPERKKSPQEVLYVSGEDETPSHCSEHENNVEKTPLQNQLLTPEYRGADYIISCSSLPSLRYQHDQEGSHQRTNEHLLFPLLPKQISSTPENYRPTLSPRESIFAKLPRQPPHQEINRISKLNIGSTNQSAFLQPPELSPSSRDSRASDNTHDDKLLLLRPQQFSSMAVPSSLKVPTIPMSMDVYGRSEICKLPMRQSSYNPVDEPQDVSFRNFRSSPYFLSRNPRMDDTSPPATTFTSEAHM